MLNELCDITPADHTVKDEAVNVKLLKNVIEELWSTLSIS